MFAASIRKTGFVLRLAILIACSIVVSHAGAFAQTDTLPSWNEGSVKKSITDFVSRVTMEGGPDFVPPAERVAVFDNDGTLWSEQPYYFQLAFAVDRIKAMAPHHPEWATKQPFKGIIENDMKAALAGGEKGLLEIVAVTHAGMTTADFSQEVLDWMATARHPRFQRPYTGLIYQPMLELMSFLRSNGFKTFIVSGGGVRFAGIVHHTDAEREYAYDRQSKFGKLDKALDEAIANKWTVVDMRQDWKTVFPGDR